MGTCWKSETELAGLGLWTRSLLGQSGSYVELEHFFPGAVEEYGEHSPYDVRPRGQAPQKECQQTPLSAQC